MIKKIFFPVILLAGVIACSNNKREVKLSPETKLNLSAFESEWKAVGDNLKLWGDRLTINTNEIRNLDSIALAGVNEKSSAKIKAMGDSLEIADEAARPRLLTLKDNYTQLLNKWTERDSSYKEWKSQLSSGDVKEEKVPETLTSYRELLGKIKTDLAAWDAELSTIRESCVGIALRMQESLK